MTWTPTPRLPKCSLPPRLRSGDALEWEVQTTLSLGCSVFFVLTGVIAGTPTRLTLPLTGAPPGVAVNATGLASFAVQSTDTAAWLPGRYQWICFAVYADGNRDELAQGVIRITPNPTATTVADPRSYNEKLLYAIKCLLTNKANSDVVMYKIGTRELTKMSVDELEKWQARVESRVRRERIRRGEKVPTKTIGVTFGGRGSAL